MWPGAGNAPTGRRLDAYGLQVGAAVPDAAGAGSRAGSWTPCGMGAAAVTVPELGAAWAAGAGQAATVARRAMVAARMATSRTVRARRVIGPPQSAVARRSRRRRA